MPDILHCLAANPPRRDDLHTIQPSIRMQAFPVASSRS